MDIFEFVQIPVAIVLGFAISEILAGWGQQLRHRGERPFFGLQLVASAYVLMWAFRYLWIQWSNRPEVWDYATYLLTLAPAILIALAAHVIRFDATIHLAGEESLYERSRRPVCVLLACVPPVQAVRAAYSVDPLSVDASARLIFFVAFSLTSLVFVWLATTDRTRSQWIGWSINWAILLLIFWVLLPELSPSGG